MDFLLHTLLQLVYLYSMVIFVYIIMSWVPGARESQIGYFLASICEPFLEPFRRIIPPIGGMIDVSPIVALLVLRLFVPIGLQEIFSFFANL